MHMTQFSEFSSVGVLIYNAGKGVWGDIGSVNTEGFKGHGNPTSSAQLKPCSLSYRA